MKGSGDSVRIAVIGGGAAGIFAAISAKEENPATEVVVFENSPRFLSKVKISGGGRCNVTHACFDPKELATRYARGSKELIGPFYRWQPGDTVDWFARHGVELKTEPDGRMFPTTDSSQTIIDCLLKTARKTGVELLVKTGINSVHSLDTGNFILTKSDGTTVEADRLVLATGGGRNSTGHQIARSFGHRIAPLAPSLFTFHIKDPLIEGLQGLSVEEVSVSCPSANLGQTGPLLITHWGLSGPAILKLSAWGARFFAERAYRFELRVNWTGTLDRDNATQSLLLAKQRQANKQIGSAPLWALPRRLWERLLQREAIDPGTRYSQVPHSLLRSLAGTATACLFKVDGKSMNKEEFVTCGGVSLNEIDFKRMESKRVPGLFFAGETLDIDGVTGGFNFQAAWTTGRIAGTSAAQ